MGADACEVRVLAEESTAARLAKACCSRQRSFSSLEELDLTASSAAYQTGADAPDALPEAHGWLSFGAEVDWDAVALRAARDTAPTVSDFAGEVPDEDARTSAEEELMQLVGLDEAKRRLMEVARFARRKHELDPGCMPALTFAFEGPPGTGKTTVARIFARILGEEGVLAHPERFVEVGRADLVARYVGQTAPKVRQRREEARGGVLYIDEAYQLAEPGSGNDFGPEALAALVKGMEDMHSELVVILSGYTEPMRRMISVNEGLASRIAFTVPFEPYAVPECAHRRWGTASRSTPRW